MKEAAKIDMSDPKLEAWLKRLFSHASSNGEELVVDLVGALTHVYLASRALDAGATFTRGAKKFWSSAAEMRAECRAAKRELLEKTAGLPFRLDTPGGPYFLGWELEDLAGDGCRRVGDPWPAQKAAVAA